MFVASTEPEEHMEEIPDDCAWMFHARCRGVNPVEFFPSDGVGVEDAQRVCAECPVRGECLDYALLHRIMYGVWGGTSERERRRIRLRRSRSRPTAASTARQADPPPDRKLWRALTQQHGA
jgi:WhiB family redox-sensing transcriptional regulator